LNACDVVEVVVGSLEVFLFSRELCTDAVVVTDVAGIISCVAVCLHEIDKSMIIKSAENKQKYLHFIL
jgi:hypothetical protein